MPEPTAPPIEGLITNFVVSQSEKRKAIDQFQPNDYYTSLSVQLSKPANISNIEDVKQVLKLASAAVTMCKISNRESQIRDGINPGICKDISTGSFDSQGKIEVGVAIAPGKEKHFLLHELGLSLPAQTAPTVSRPFPEVPQLGSTAGKGKHDSLRGVK